MISIRSIGVAWPLQSMELSLHTVEVVGVSIRHVLLSVAFSISASTLHFSFFSGFFVMSPCLSPNPLCLA
jgi:hypothetical protein